MRDASPPTPPGPALLPEGRRWGFGAHSVVPYLSQSLQQRPGTADAVTGGIRNPVFPAMDETLRVWRRRH